VKVTRTAHKGITVENIKGKRNNGNYDSTQIPNSRNKDDYVIPGLINVESSPRAEHELRYLALHEDNVIAGASDGSVLDSNDQGTWAWTIMTSGKTPEPMGIHGRGREWVNGLETQETHSYRMEALGLLSALTYIRIRLRWKGKIQWHMDSTSVIDTFKFCDRMGQTKWVKQRDKGVWTELIKEKQRWGPDRINLYHVEAHTDTKHKKGLRGPPTAIEKINIFADELADTVYKEHTLPGMNTSHMRQYGQWSITQKKHLITGHWRNQIKEQIRMERTKLVANKDQNMWGNCPEEIYKMGLDVARNADLGQEVKDYLAGKGYPLEVIKHTVGQYK